MSSEMHSRRVKDLMVSLGECPVVSEDATLRDAVLALDEAQKKLPAGRQPYRAVLVIDDKKRIAGKIGQLALLGALRLRHDVIAEFESLSPAGVSDEFVSSMMEHYRFFHEALPDLCSGASTLLVKVVMRPINQNISETASLSEAIHKMVMWQTLSILVTRGAEVVGLLRLSDIFDAVAAQLKTAAR